MPKAPTSWEQWEVLSPSKGRPNRQSTNNSVILIGSFIGLCDLVFLLAVLGCLIANRRLENVKTTRRLEKLNQELPPALFSKWYEDEQANHPNWPHIDQEDHVCIICLIVIQGHDLVRALKCRHVYHTQCFDRWFTGPNEFCPLCQRLVLTAEENTIA